MEDPRAALLHSLLTGQTVAALATLHGGRPAVSMVPFALVAGSNALAIHVSALATHTRDMEASPEVAMLVTATQTDEVSPQALPRITINGKAARCSPEHEAYVMARAAYLARFPHSEPMFGFGDFSLFLIEPSSVRGVAGFGQAWSITRAQFAGFMADGARGLASVAKPGKAPRLVGAIPKLASLDIEESLAFFERLGFRRTFCTADYGVVERDGVAIHFWHCDDPRIPAATGCRIVVSGVDELFEAYSRLGVIHPNGQLETKPWGQREFSILDRYGNLVTFQEAPQAAAAS